MDTKVSRRAARPLPGSTVLFIVPRYFDSSIMESVDRQRQGNDNGNVTIVFPGMGGVARAEPFAEKRFASDHTDETDFLL